MEPDHLERMKTPEGIPEDKVRLTKAYKIPQLKERWENNMFFKDFHQKTIQTYSWSILSIFSLNEQIIKIY